MAPGHAVRLYRLSADIAPIVGAFYKKSVDDETLRYCILLYII